MVHDPALEALVDEVGVARVARRQARRRAPQLEVEQADEVRVADVGLTGRDRAEERRLELTGSPSKVSGAFARTKSRIAAPYPAASALGVRLLSCASGAGTTLPLKVVYGSSPSSSRLRVWTPPPPQRCITRRWKNWVVHPRKGNARLTGKPNVLTWPRDWK
jgi:hypothetical protein